MRGEATGGLSTRRRSRPWLSGVCERSCARLRLCDPGDRVLQGHSSSASAEASRSFNPREGATEAGSYSDRAWSPPLPPKVPGRGGPSNGHASCSGFLPVPVHSCESLQVSSAPQAHPLQPSTHAGRTKSHDTSRPRPGCTHWARTVLPAPAHSSQGSAQLGLTGACQPSAPCAGRLLPRFRSADTIPRPASQRYILVTHSSRTLGCDEGGTRIQGDSSCATRLTAAATGGAYVRLLRCRTSTARVHRLC